MAKGDLTPKQELFCHEYLVDLNATQAALRAGYSQKTAYSIGFENLKKPEIQATIGYLRKKLAMRLDVTKDQVITELARVAFSDVRMLFDEHGNLIPVAELSDDAARAVASVEIVSRRLDENDASSIETTAKIKTYDKLKALEMLSKHLGLFERDNKQQPAAVSQVILYWPHNNRDVKKPPRITGDQFNGNGKNGNGAV